MASKHYKHAVSVYKRGTTTRITNPFYPDFTVALAMAGPFIR